MRRRLASLRSVLVCGTMLSLGCATGDPDAPSAPVGGEVDGDAHVDSGVDPSDASAGADTGGAFDAPAETTGDTGPLDPDAACATATQEAKTEVLPVDVIWMVDNSASMAPAVAEVKAGLNAFAALIDAKKLDYKVIVLSVRSKTSPITLGGGTRYPVCIPPPLAGDDACGNGPRFFHSNVDIKSTQPLEQLLGTLDQTDGYKLGQERGGEPWKDQLRPEASKTIVVVTDDNARLSATDFETFAGGKNPFNSLTLGPGVLHPSRKGLFDGYVFGGIYGWGSETETGVTCVYGDGSKPPSSGPTYTALVSKTGGPRAKLCDGPAAWSSFFDAIATAVVKSAKLSCTLELPVPPEGTLDPSAVNVRITGASGTTVIPQVPNAAACGTDVAWYYDDPAAPKKVILCPAACDAANAAVGVDKPGKIDVLFGCKTVIK